MSPLPGAVLVLHSLPLEFPLAIAFAEQLLTWKLEETSERSEDELDTVPPSVLLQVVELLGRLKAQTLEYISFLKLQSFINFKARDFLKVYILNDSRTFH